MNKLSKMEEYRISCTNECLFYIPPIKIQRRSWNTIIPFTIALKKINQLGINLTTEVKYLYNEKFTFLKKEMEKDTRKWKNTLYSQIYIVKKEPFYQKPFADSMHNPNQNPDLVCHRNRKSYPEITMEPQMTPDSQNNPQQKEERWRDCHSRSQNILQDHSNKRTYGTGKNQTCRSMGQN